MLATKGTKERSPLIVMLVTKLFRYIIFEQVWTCLLNPIKSYHNIGTSLDMFESFLAILSCIHFKTSLDIIKNRIVSNRIMISCIAIFFLRAFRWLSLLRFVICELFTS